MMRRTSDARTAIVVEKDVRGCGLEVKVVWKRGERVRALNA